MIYSQNSAIDLSKNTLKKSKYSIKTIIRALLVINKAIWIAHKR